MPCMKNVLSSFKKWYEQHKEEFAVTLETIPRRKGQYRFCGYSRNISLSVDDSGIFVWAFFDNEPVDMLTHYDLFSKFARGKGYFNGVNLEPYYYATAGELYENECFIPFRGWVNSMLRPSHCLFIHRAGGKNDMTWAYLDTAKKPSTSRIVRKMLGKSSKDIEIIKLDVRVTENIEKTRCR